jgi:hypothetical protein
VTCAECSFCYETLAVAAIPARLRSLGPGFRDALADIDPAVASQRPGPTVWSALEYACHVRDVLLVQRDRAVLAQVEDNPSFARMYRDERVMLCRYDAHAVPDVLGQLDMAAELCATVFDGLDRTAWGRPLVYNWPAATGRDLAWLGRHTVHEGDHHLMDVRNVMLALADRP